MHEAMRVLRISVNQYNALVEMLLLLLLMLPVIALLYSIHTKKMCTHTQTVTVSVTIKDFTEKKVSRIN